MRQKLAVRTLSLLALLTLVPTLADAQFLQRKRLFAELPTCDAAHKGNTYTVMNATDNATCDGNGTAAVTCRCSGTTYEAITDSITVTGAAGIAVTDGAVSTASTEADFLASGALTCGASTQGKAKVHTTPLQYCDNATTPTLQYAAYGNSAGAATSALDVAKTGQITVAASGAGNDVTVTAADDIILTPTDAFALTAVSSLITGPVSYAWQTVTTASDGAGTSPSQTITVTSNFIKCACNDPDNCNDTLSETLPDTTDATEIVVVSTGSGSCVFADSSGVQELSGTLTLGANDVAKFLYTGSTWVQSGSAINN